MVLALGFRVRSPMAVRFRQWAADKLKEYITKGFVLDDESLKNPDVGNDYFQIWITKLEGFLTLNDRDILTHARKISADAAKSHAEVEFSEFRKAENLRLESDFDRAVKNLPPPPGAGSPARKRKPKP